MNLNREVGPTMTKTRWLIALAAAAVLFALPTFAGDGKLVPFVLFGGGNTSAAVDTLEQLSPWIPVRGARRIIIRTWSSKAAWSFTTDADSTYSDSITVFKVAFSDSVSGFVVGPSGQSYPVAQDSTVITTTTVSTVDTTSKMVAVMHPPLQEALRGPGNGSGIITWVVPVTPGLATADNNGFIAPQYMRVLFTPLRRQTVGGTSGSPTGKKTVGLKGLRMVAYVVYDNK